MSNMSSSGGQEDHNIAGHLNTIAQTDSIDREFDDFFTSRTALSSSTQCKEVPNQEVNRNITRCYTTSVNDNKCTDAATADGAMIEIDCSSDLESEASLSSQLFNRFTRRGLVVPKSHPLEESTVIDSHSNPPPTPLISSSPGANVIYYDNNTKDRWSHPDATEVAHAAEYRGSSRSPRHMHWTGWTLHQYPFLKSIPLFPELARTFGLYTIVGIILVCFLTKGIVSHMLFSSAVPLFKDTFKLQWAQYHEATTVVTLGWALKPVMGMLSDFIVLSGYHKRWWVSIMAMVGCVGALVFAAIPGPHSVKEGTTNTSHISDATVTICGIIVAFSESAIDVLVVGYCCELMHKTPKLGTALVLFAYGSAAGGGIVACIIIALLSSRLSLVVIAMAVGLSVLPLSRNWIAEGRFRRIRPSVPSLYFSPTSQNVGLRRDADIIVVEEDNGRNGTVYVGDNNNAPSEEKCSLLRSESMRVITTMEEDEQVSIKEDEGVSRNSTNSADVDLHTGTRDTNDQHTSVYPSEVLYQQSCKSYNISRIGIIFLSDKVAQHKYLIRYGLLMCVCSFIMVILTVTFTFLNSFRSLLISTQLLAALIITASLIFFSLRYFPKIVSYTIVFVLSKEVLYIRFPGGPMGGFLAAAQKCNNGPYLSDSYYQIISSIFGAMAGMVGVIIFYKVFSKWSLHSIFYTTTLIKIVASICDVIIMKRWNILYLKFAPFFFFFNDKIFYFLVNCVMINIVEMIDLISIVLYVFKLCPNGIECSTYAILTGISSFGILISNIIGAFASSYIFHIQTTETISHDVGSRSITQLCDFNNFVTSSLWCRLFIPFFIIPLIPLLLPNCRIDDGKEMVNYGESRPI